MSNTALTSSSRGSLEACSFLLGGKLEFDSTFPAALPSISVSPRTDGADGQADRDAPSPGCDAGSLEKDGSSFTASKVCKSRVSARIQALISPFFLTWHSTFGGVNCKKLGLSWSVAGGEADAVRSSLEISHFMDISVWGGICVFSSILKAG